MTFGVTLHPQTAQVATDRIAQLVEARVASRILARDAGLWGPEAASEARIRLGWTSSPNQMLGFVEELRARRVQLVAQGIDRVVLCGMGGSSLAPEVIARHAGIPLTILDSTHPDQVARALEGNLAQSLIVVSSKSGGTVETAAARAAFAQALTNQGLIVAEHLVVVTDPDSPLEVDARAHGLTVFLADPEVGGRFSALTAFGLVPGTLSGADTLALLHQAQHAHGLVSLDQPDNPAILLAAALANPDQPYAILVPQSASLPGLGDWIEQLVAESTGKEHTGVLPVVVDSSSAPEVTHRSADSLLIALSESGSADFSADVVVSGSLGEQFVLWQWATAMAGYLLQINPFDQPDVESAKVATRALLDARPEPATPLAVEQGVAISQHHIGIDAGNALSSAWREVIDRAGTDGYIALQVYADRLADGPWTTLRDTLAELSGRPVTLGFGPRFLHSTGQFHKGGRPTGVFVQIEVPASQTVAIPGFPFDFGQLIDAQAAGDSEVLAARGLPVLTLRLTSEDSALALVRALDALR